MFLNIKKLYKSIIHFLHFARKHKISTKPENWWKGVLLLIIGWGLIAINIVTFNFKSTPSILSLYFLIQFISGTVFVFIVIFFLHIFKMKNFFAHKFLAISKNNERDGSGILTVRERKTLILTRGFFAVISYIGFELAKIAVGAVDNSIIFSSDGLMYALLAMIFLKERFRLIEWIGILTSVLGIAIIFYFDFLTNSLFLGVFGGVAGVISSIFMAIILILTSVIVQHDYPIRIAFYQCFCGLIVSIFITLIFLPWSNLDTLDLNFDFLCISIQQGVLYSTALICFFRAFYYVNVIVVAISSYTLDILTTIFEALFYNKVASTRDLICSVIISLGIGILIYAEHRKNSLESQNH